MMRITRQQDGETFTFKIEGRLAGEWVEEMARCWDEASKSDRSRVIRIDLTEVTFIDATGKKLLAAMFAAGVTPAAANLMTKAVIEQLCCRTQIEPQRRDQQINHK